MAFSFNGTHISTLGFRARLLDVPLLPEFTQESLSLPELRGERDLPRKIKGRTLNFELGLKALSKAEQQKKLSSLAKLLDQDAAPLILDLSPERFITARLKEAPIFSRIGAFSLRGTLSFYSADPYFYSTTPLEQEFHSAGTKQLSFRKLQSDLKTPLMLSLQAQGQTVVHISQGTKQITLTHTFKSGETLEYDSKLKTVRIIQGFLVRSGLSTLSAPIFFEVSDTDQLSVRIQNSSGNLSAIFRVYGKWRTP